jgi:hypothetical protein
VCARPQTCRTAIWHGTGNKIVSTLHAEWWGEVIPAAQLRLVEGEGHISLVGRHSEAILLDALHWAEKNGGKHTAAAAELVSGGAGEGVPVVVDVLTEG